MPLAVNHPTAVAYRGDVYVHGGYTANLGLDRAHGRAAALRPVAQSLEPPAVVAHARVRRRPTR